MKNIITAINNPELNNEIKKEKNLKIINKDIIYKEGIIEILEEKKEINLIIINYDLPGKIEIEDLVNKIKKIHMKKSAAIFLKENNFSRFTIRFDVIEVYMINGKCKINHIKQII